MSEHIIETEVYAGTPFVPIGGTDKLREEIVRCRDCKHCRRDDSRWHCSELMFDIDWVTSDTAPDSFCAWGERK